MKPKKMKSSVKKIAFCNFDGTLSKGYISMGFLDYVYNQKTYSEQYYKKQMDLYSQVKNKEISYDYW